MAVSVTAAGVAEAAAIARGAPPVTDEVIAGRIAICKACDDFVTSQSRCKKCGCVSAWKSRLRSQRCIDGKW